MYRLPGAGAAAGVQLTSAPGAADDDVREAVALIDVLLALGVKVEQERY